MSRETDQWLNTMTLIGNTEQRGMAWHYRADLQTEHITASGRKYLGNHYPGAIPIEDVKDRLFDWEADLEDVLLPNGHIILGKKAVVPSDDPTHVFEIVSDTYMVHGFDEWLLGNVAEMVGGGVNDGMPVHISSAGLIKGRSIAWVELSLKDTVWTNAGVGFRPNILATTSLNRTVKTTYKRTAQLVVCDNTYYGAMAEKGEAYARKHTRNSGGKLEMDKAREALGLIVATVDDMEKEIQRMTEIEVTRKEFDSIVEELIPITDDTSKSGATHANKKRDQITTLFEQDDRVAPWNTTAFGVQQAFNTWEHHIKATHGDTNRAERNMHDAIIGNTSKNDHSVWNTIVKVKDLGKELVVA
jgi:phage/plasmid-like protein (TIGR03299 family)